MASSWVVFHVTERCALACRHCLRDPGPKPQDLDPDLVDRVLEQAKRLYRIGHVGFTGGEPLLHPRLDAILDAVVRHGLTWHVVTSGRTFDRLLALAPEGSPRRAALTAIDLSVDGAREATHDAIRGQGSWREVMGAAAACHARSIPFSFQMTVNAVNVAEVEEVGIAAAQLGAARVFFSMTQATGTAEDARLALPAASWRAIADRVFRLAEVLRIPVVAAEGFPREQPLHVCDPWRGEILHVDPHGRLTLCCQHSGTPGGDEEVAVDLAQVGLVEAHRRVLHLAQRLQRERLDAIERGGLSDWDLSPCNWCLAALGRPHWTERGGAGPRARRRRGEG
jgi:MoaA/NifB/PqqE/SkfB family radical SAM enzyme